MLNVYTLTVLITELLVNLFIKPECWEYIKTTVFGWMCFEFSVDNDPHFIVNMTGSSNAICFSIDGKPGDVLQLVKDDDKGNRGIIYLLLSTF